MCPQAEQAWGDSIIRGVTKSATAYHHPNQNIISGVRENIKAHGLKFTLRRVKIYQALETQQDVYYKDLWPVACNTFPREWYEFVHKTVARVFQDRLLTEEGEQEERCEPNPKRIGRLELHLYSCCPGSGSRLENYPQCGIWELCRPWKNIDFLLEK